mmetsp:Transcript_12835/g.23617  ORF Transcript_12835/g.23617 Transcript_12835/m.23617 type:complete len:371 (-) Transcript_12835:12-1124(-)
MPPQHTNLLSELQSNNAYFDSVVNMIPARLYVAGASGDDAFHAKYRKGQHKESKEARQARAKIAKQSKFDPEKVETTLELKKRVKREEDENDSDDEDGGDAEIQMSDGDGDDENDTGDATEEGKKEESAPSNNDSYVSRIEMLRAKLHAKMAEKRAAAGITSSDGAADGSGNAATIDTSAPALVSKRAARRVEKRKRQEAAKQRSKKKAHTVAVQKQTDQQRVVNLGGSTLNAPTAAKALSSSTTAAQDLATIDYQGLAGLKPKLRGALDNKSLGTKKKKSLEDLLADAERKQARLRELKESGTEEDQQKAKNLVWGEALKVAGGDNIRKTNDPKLLKKAIKRKAKKKTASVKAWNVRVDSVKDAKNKKQ